MFSEKDQKFILQRGSSMETVLRQIDYFKSGFPSLALIKPALAGDGIKVIDDEKKADLINSFEDLMKDVKTVKFVPASGAASRMFKELFAFMDSYDGSDEAYEKMIANTGSQSAFSFFKNLEKFAFYDDLKAAFRSHNGTALEEAHLKRAYVDILKVFLTEDGLNYGALPKGLLKFHKYADGTCRTPVEEHMVEGANYAKDQQNVVKLHFTVSPEHKEKFAAHVAEVRPLYEKKFGVTYQVSYSEQKKSTDTIAVDLNNEPFREEDGSLLFRPAGHGALIENLNDLDADIAFIKNIDNVVPDGIREETYTYKKVVFAVLAQFQEKIFHFLELIESGVTEEILTKIIDFIEEDLCIQMTLSAGASTEEKVAAIRAKLNRPIRVCGMVKNEGDTGGGPFWAKNPDGSVSLQVVETAQIDLKNPAQKEIFDQASHFNPVDIVCSLKNYKGEKFDLLKYTDPMTGFITQKSKDGKDLKAQELPGLWNGAMSDWNTIFVEVPLITFNPVKSVNDLLKDEHQ